MFSGTIGVLRGGPGAHYDTSLSSGTAVSKALRDKYPTRDIYIDKEGTWHFEGMPAQPSRLVSHIDLFWNALHGEYGEDGSLQRDLDNLGAKYTGPGATQARFAWRKDLAKRYLKEAELLVPEAFSVRLGDDVEEAAREAFTKIGGQYIVKPVAEANSRGVFFVPSFPELAQVLGVALEHFDHVLIEEAIHGREIKCLVARDFRGEDYYSFLPVEIHKGVSVGVYKTEGNDSAQVFVPARISNDEKVLIMDTARRAHKALDLGEYSLVDMILAKRGVVVLELDALPDLSEDSIVSRSLAAVGATPSEFFRHVALRAHAG